MTYNASWIGKIVEIDCDNRQVLLKNDEDDTTGTDISSYVDFNSDWFSLQGDFKFSTVSCAILAVIYQKRW